MSGLVSLVFELDELLDRLFVWGFYPDYVGAAGLRTLGM